METGKRIHWVQAEGQVLCGTVRGGTVVSGTGSKVQIWHLR